MKQPFNYSVVSDQTKTIHQWHEILNQRFEATPREAARYYGIQILPRLLHRLDNLKSTCHHCAAYYNQLDEMTMHASGWMVNNDPQLKNFQNQLRQTGQHLSHKHGIVAKGLWLARFTVAGLITGILVGLAVGLTAITLDLPGIIMLGAAVGLAIGWIAGKMKESTLRKKHKLF